MSGAVAFLSLFAPLSLSTLALGVYELAALLCWMRKRKAARAERERRAAKANWEAYRAELMRMEAAQLEREKRAREAAEREKHEKEAAKVRHEQERKEREANRRRREQERKEREAEKLEAARLRAEYKEREVAAARELAACKEREAAARTVSRKKAEKPSGGRLSFDALEDMAGCEIMLERNFANYTKREKVQIVRVDQDRHGRKTLVYQYPGTFEYGIEGEELFDENRKYPLRAYIPEACAA